MSNCDKNEKFLGDDEWALVDIPGSVVPKQQSPSEKERNEVRKKDVTDPEPEFQAIQHKDLTTSTIIATTEIPPLGKNYQHDDHDHLRMAKNPQINCNMTNDLYKTMHDKKVEGPSSNELVFNQIPQQDSNPVENFSDSSSISSFDIIEGKKIKSPIHDNSDHAPIFDLSKDVTQDDMGSNLSLDFPTLLALICLAAALGFVIGHGIGIATTFLVIKMPNVEPPPEITRAKISNSLQEMYTEKSQDSQLEGKIRKWKATYRNHKTTQGQYDNVREMNPKIAMPGLKEAHKHLSVENFELKKANEELQKQLDLMKVMSRHRKLQLDNLKTEAKQNKSYVMEVLMKELEYLEGMYMREKKFADMWRNEQEKKDEEEQKPKSKVNSWKEFKERWTEVHDKGSLEDSYAPTAPFKDTCEVRGICDGKYEDVMDTITHTVDEEIEKEPFMDQKGISGESLSWQQLSETKNVQDGSQKKKEMEFKVEYEELDIMPEALIKDTSNGNSRIIKNMAGSVGISRTNNNFVKNTIEAVTGDDLELPKYEETSSKDGDESNKMTLGAEKDHHGSDWFQREVLESKDDTVVAYENMDNRNHMLYGFWNGNFHEVLSSPGDIFAMLIRKECFNVSQSFVVSIQNNSPKPIDFFAVLPNGKVKHQEVGEEVKITMVHLGQPDGQGLAGENTVEKPIIYEAIVTTDGKLGVTPQEDDQQLMDERKNVENNVKGDEINQVERITKYATEYKNVEETSSSQDIASSYQTLPISSENEDSSEYQHTAENEVNLENEHNLEMESDQENLSNQASETAEAGGNIFKKRKADDACNLKLGESKENEYWTICDKWMVLVTKERVDRVKESSLSKEEDMKKLNVHTKNVEETMSYIYCGDGTVVRTWQMTEKMGNEEIFGPEQKSAEQSVSGGENVPVCGDNDSCKKSHGGGETMYTESNRPNKENSSAKVSGNVEKDLGTEILVELGNVEFDEDQNNEENYDDGNDDHDDHDDDTGDSHNKRKVESSRTAHLENARTTSDDGMKESDILSKKSEKLRTKYPREMQGHEKAKGYSQYLKSEWRNLKMRQRQFEVIKLQNLRLKKRMTEEWKQMKDNYRKFLKNIRKSEAQMEAERAWKDMKFQQRQFDNWKTQVIEELKDHLKKEWVKLKEVRQEIEMKDKQLNFERETFLQRYQTKSVEYPEASLELTERDVSDTSGNVDESASLAWELTNVENDELVNQEKPPAFQEMPTTDSRRQIDNQNANEKMASKEIGLEHKSFQQSEESPLAQMNTIKKGEKISADNYRTERPPLEELDRLYERSFSTSGYQRNGNEVQITNADTNFADWSPQKNEQSHTQSIGKDWPQPKCPLKCPPQNNNYLTSEPEGEVMSSLEIPPVEKESPEMIIDERKMESGYALSDVIQGYELYLRKLKTEWGNEARGEMEGPLPPEDTKLSAWKKKKRTKKHEDHDPSLIEKAKKKWLPKKRNKAKEKHDLHIKKRRNAQGFKKGNTQNSRSFGIPKGRKGARKRDEQPRNKWVYKIR